MRYFAWSSLLHLDASLARFKIQLTIFDTFFSELTARLRTRRDDKWLKLLITLIWLPCRSRMSRCNSASRPSIRLILHRPPSLHYPPLILLLSLTKIRCKEVSLTHQSTISLRRKTHKNQTKPLWRNIANLTLQLIYVKKQFLKLLWPKRMICRKWA